MCARIGVLGAALYSFHADSDTARSTDDTRFGSYDGHDQNPRISPVRGSSATTDPSRSPSWSRAVCCTSLRSDTITSPELRFVTNRSVNPFTCCPIVVPTSSSLYCFSSPVDPYRNEKNPVDCPNSSASGYSRMRFSSAEVSGFGTLRAITAPSAVTIDPRGRLKSRRTCAVLSGLASSDDFSTTEIQLSFTKSATNRTTIAMPRRVMLRFTPAPPPRTPSPGCAPAGSSDR